jgi:uncharacterized RDD family membrane protein YckC
MQPSYATPTGFVTPEAVILDLPIAGPGTRMLARLIDLAAVSVALVALDLVDQLLVRLGSPGVIAVAALSLFAGFGVLLVYPVLMEGLWGGRTLGKWALGLRVVRADGGPIDIRQAAVRAALGLVEVWGTLGWLGLTTIMVSKRDQRLGDMAAGTVVLRQRRNWGLRPLTPINLMVPPGCEPLVYTMDIGAMKATDYELVRLFLVRWHDFAPARRPFIAAKLAGPLWERFRHPLPGWLGPEYYLACLGAAYQIRHPYNPPPAVVPTAPGQPGNDGWGSNAGWVAATGWGAGVGRGWSWEAGQGWSADPAAGPAAAPSDWVAPG